MLTIYQSNTVERLFAELARLLIQSKSAPLEADWVVVENPGLAHWLKMQLAQALGVAANIEFPMPSRFFWQIQRQLMPDLADESIFSKDSLSWLIHERLPDLESQVDFEPLLKYRQGNTEQQQFQLSGQIADLFDQYLVYRPDWIHQWEDGECKIGDIPLGEQDRWQARLWYELRQYAQQKQLPLSHRASMLEEFQRLLVNPSASARLPKQVVFFGFSALPKHQLETLHRLSKHMDIHVMTPNPSQFYWGDVLDEQQQARLRLRGREALGASSGNPLLASFGRMGKEYQRLLLEMDSVEEHSLFFEQAPHNLLQHLQHQILQLEDTVSEPVAIDSQDASVQMVGCHSPMRELEVLHDHLLSLFESKQSENDKLIPQDVVVMIPDVASYAPYIDAVFASRRPRIPYSISDRPAQAEHPLLSACVALLHLPDSRMTLSEVLALLETPAIYQAYALTEANIVTIKNWLEQAGIRWGFDGEDRQRQDLPSWDENSWAYGFKRLLMGYAAAGQQPVENIVPVPSVEGLEAILLGPVMSFLQDLQSYKAEASEAKSAAQWTQFLYRWLNILCSPQADEESVMETVHQAIENWAAGVQRVHYQRSIPYVLVADAIEQKLQHSGGSQHFMVGKVNFCTLLPMRSIPFKVVAILGLNDSDYPRFVPPSGFDLMQSERRLGDRSRRDEDRYLFLEALISARHSLWLSYRSKSQKDDGPLTQSVVLAELVDYFAHGFYLSGDETETREIQSQRMMAHLFTQHPLQAFNPIYYQQNSSVRSYNHDWLAAHGSADPDIDPSTTHTSNVHVSNAQATSATLELEDLLAFWMHPTRYYLNRVLDIHMPSTPTLQNDDEPFELNGLMRHQLKQQWLNECLASPDLSLDDHGEDDHSTTPHSQWLGEGILPYGSIGQGHLESIRRELKPLVLNSRALLADQTYNIQEIRVVVNLPSASQTQDVSNTLILQGWQRNVSKDLLMIVEAGKLKGRHILNALIQHSALLASGHNVDAVLLCQDQTVLFKRQSPHCAKQFLETCVQYWYKGTQTPLCFAVETAWQIVKPLAEAKASVDKKGKEKNLDLDSRVHSKDAINAFFGVNAPNLSIPGDRDDLNMIRCFDQLSSIPEAIIELSHEVFESVIETGWLKLNIDLETEATIAHLNIAQKLVELSSEQPTSIDGEV